MRFSRKGIGGSNPLVSAEIYFVKEWMDMSKPGDVMLREIAEIPRVLIDLVAHMQAEQVASELFDTQRFDSVVILARGTSDNAGHFLKYLIETKMGLPCALASPSAATMYSAEFHYEKTLLIAISQSGQSEDLLSFARAAKQGGAYLLSITNKDDSPLANIADVHIPILAGPELAVPATKTYVAQLMASYLLVMKWIKKTPHSEEIIKSSRKTVTLDKEIHDFADKINITNPIYILGRGFSYPNAKEFALKLQETCLIPVQGMSTSDFLHGPIASLDSRSQVIFISPQHLPAKSFGEAPDRVRQITNRIFWIGQNSDSYASDSVLITPRCSSEISASVADAVAFQRVTQRIATRNGLDPDRPKGLSKVTITR